jgi:hypothetical protein
LKKIFFYFQLAAIWCLFQLSFDHIVIYCIRNRDFEEKNGKTQSTVIMDEKEKQFLQSEKKTMPKLSVIMNQDDKTAQTRQIPACTVYKIK